MSVRRIAIQSDLSGAVQTVDVALSADMPIASLLPGLAELFEHSGDPGRWWRLDAAIGPPLDESMSLADNDVHDGDVLVLVSECAAHVGAAPVDHARTIAAAELPAEASTTWLAAPAAAGVAVIGAAALTWAGIVATALGPLIVATVGAVAVCGFAVAQRNAVLGVGGTAMAAAAGFLAVPEGPGPPNVLLSATAALAASVIMGRSAMRPAAVSMATSSAAAHIVLAAAFAVFVTAHPATVGTVLVTVALVALAAAPRLALLVAGIAADSTSVATRTAKAAHIALTGLVGGCAAGVAAGAALVAFAAGAAPSHWAATSFAAAAGLVLLLRTRTYVDGARKVLLGVAGTFSATAALVVTTSRSPELVGWIVAALLLIGLLGFRRGTPGPAAVRAMDLLDCVTIAAVIPLACWATGVFAVARDWQLA